MTVLLSRGYNGYPAGAITTLPASTEAAIIAQGIGTLSTAVPTAGAVTTNELQGRVTFAPAATSLVVTNANVTPSTKVGATVNQAAADTTFTNVARIVPALGSFTIFANAGATAATVVDWEINPTGLTALG